MRCPLCQEAQMIRRESDDRRTCPVCGFQLSAAEADAEQDAAYDRWVTRTPPYDESDE
jgi:uncharacterized protein (DUF983 family)